MLRNKTDCLFSTYQKYRLCDLLIFNLKSCMNYLDCWRISHRIGRSKKRPTVYIRFLFMFSMKHIAILFTSVIESIFFHTITT